MNDSDKKIAKLLETVSIQKKSLDNAVETIEGLSKQILLKEQYINDLKADKADLRETIELLRKEKL